MATKTNPPEGEQGRLGDAPRVLPDTIFSVAWHTGEPGELYVRWHRSTYGLDVANRRYTLDRFSEGRAEYIEREQLPSGDLVRESWIEYARWVEQTGEDPLDEYPVNVYAETGGKLEVVPRPQEEIAGDLVVAARSYLARHRQTTPSGTVSDGPEEEIPNAPRL